jgi:predicted transcriptional regulator
VGGGGVMIFRYWIEFDENGDIKACHKSKYECPIECEEFVVKLIKVDREQEEFDKKMVELVKESDEFLVAAKKAAKNSDKFKTEFQKTMRELRRIKI